MTFIMGQVHRRYNAFLPDDVLRQVFETATRLDGRTASNLALLSRRIRPWIDEIMYSDVVLTNHRNARAFLRTIQMPEYIKPVDFFATRVKSLVIYADIDTENLVTLLSICRGVTNLSYWPSPAYANGVVARNNNGSRILKTPVPWDSHTHPNAAPNISSSPLPLLQAAKIHAHAVMHSFNLHNLSHVGPRKMSLMLHDSHPLFVFRPGFEGSPFFADVTHLSILNRWEEWTAWAGHRMSTEDLPCLTHLKLDLAVGQAPSEKPRSLSPSCSRWLETVTDSSNPSLTESERMISPAEGAWTYKITSVANAISDVLNNLPSLIVCVLVLRFDSNPARTAKLISSAAALRMTYSSSPSSSSRNAVQSLDFDMDWMDVDTEAPDSSPKLDPRLIFAWEKESFRYNYAHSVQETLIWKSAESIAKAQQYLAGYTMLNCDDLI